MLCDAARRPDWFGRYPKGTHLMSEISIVNHKGTDIILLDFVDTKNADAFVADVAAADRFIDRQPATARLRTCTDVRNTTFDRRVVDAMKNITRKNAARVTAAAVVSDSAIHRAAIGMIVLFSRRKIETFDTREGALDWLAAQG